jgi:aryl-alcohol dehydrogenase-like predicted oxidoreductase
VVSAVATLPRRRLGASGLSVPPLCLGAMTFGEADGASFMHKVSCDAETSFAIMDRALEAGVDFIDTADVYGQDGLSERVVGDWMAGRNNRDAIVLATKFRFSMPYGKGASRRHIMAACEASLRRLKTDRIDLYQIHMQDRDVPEEETLRALDDLVHQGKVLYLGASNYAAYRLVDSLWTSKANGLCRFVGLQMQYSLIERALEREHVPTCAAHGLGILPWSPLGGGFLTGKYRREQAPPPGARLEHWKDRLKGLDQERNWAILAAVDAVAAEHGATPAQIALAWLLHQRCVTSVIFGARTVQQLEDNLPAATLSLSADQLARLDGASKVAWGYPYDFIGRIQGGW